jgi:hypothetical protein
LDEEKSKHAGFLLGKMVLAQHFCTGWLQEQYNLTPVVDWLRDSIRPGGLLLVVSHLLQSPVQFYGWSWEKKVNN